LNVGQVYTTLQRLERDGLVQSEGDGEGPQKAYRILPGGADELSAWLRTPPDLSSPPRDELVMKVLVALRVPGASVPEIIQAHRRYLIQLMQQWTHIKEDSGAADLSLSLAVDAELFRLDSVVRWLDAADARIKRARAAGEPPLDSPATGAARRPGEAAAPAEENQQWPLPRPRTHLRTRR
ncbi:MAG TPA: PadR family transcriptional regulator, partial [Streptosporangiaceae bacterium]